MLAPKKYGTVSMSSHVTDEGMIERNKKTGWIRGGRATLFFVVVGVLCGLALVVTQRNHVGHALSNENGMALSEQKEYFGLAKQSPILSDDREVAMDDDDDDTDEPAAVGDVSWASFKRYLRRKWRARRRRRRKCPNPRIRKDWTDLTQKERELFIEGWVRLQRKGRLATFTTEHVEAASKGFDKTSFHGNAGFFPWHRYFIWELEQEIQSLGPRFACFSLPYWDWTRMAGKPVGANPMFKQGLGGNGSPKLRNCVVDGSWLSYKRGYTTSANICLTRKFEKGTDWYQTTAEMLRLAENNTMTYVDFRAQMEAWHGRTHLSIGGELSNINTATDDPLFYMLHTFVDMMWAVRSDCHGYNTNKPNDARIFPIGENNKTMNYPVLARAPWALATRKHMEAGEMLTTLNWGYTYDMSDMKSRSGMAMARCNFKQIRGAGRSDRYGAAEEVLVAADKADAATALAACKARSSPKLGYANGTKLYPCPAKADKFYSLEEVLAPTYLTARLRAIRTKLYPWARWLGTTHALCNGEGDNVCAEEVAWGL